jgi:cytochrome c
MRSARTLTIGAALALCAGIVALAQTPAANPKAPARAAAQTPTTFGIGRAATTDDIAKVDIDIHPDGKGLPAGSATSADGTPIYAAKCASCHGKTGKEGPNDRLVGRVPGDGFPFARESQVPHTIGNYWPYATTVFDYIRRAMPPTEPGSLKDNDVYALTAYLLFLNDLIPADAVIDATSLPKIKMPSRDRFVPDPRGGPKPAATKAPSRPKG